MSWKTMRRSHTHCILYNYPIYIYMYIGPYIFYISTCMCIYTHILVFFQDFLSMWTYQHCFYISAAIETQQSQLMHASWVYLSLKIRVVEYLQWRTNKGKRAKNLANMNKDREGLEKNRSLALDDMFFQWDSLSPRSSSSHHQLRLLPCIYNPWSL